MHSLLKNKTNFRKEWTLNIFTEIQKLWDFVRFLKILENYSYKFQLLKPKYMAIPKNDYMIEILCLEVQQRQQKNVFFYTFEGTDGISKLVLVSFL